MGGLWRLTGVMTTAEFETRLKRGVVMVMVKFQNKVPEEKA